MIRLVKKTEAAVLFEFNQPLRVINLDIPALKPGQVLVELAYSGVCASQLLEVKGKRGKDAFLPHTLGHEGSGVVLEVGPGVNKVKPGDKVILSWIKGNGADVSSVTYQSLDGLINSGAISTFMRHTVTCENRVTSIPHEMPLREAALFGCAIPTGCGIIFNTAKIRSGESIAIFGVGGVGMSALLAAKLVNANPIIAVDILDQKLDWAKQSAPTYNINAQKHDPLRAILNITGGRGVDYAIEATGHKIAMETAFRSVRERGGICILAGNLSKGEQISIDPFDLIKGRKIMGTWGGETDLDRDIPIYIDFFLSGKLPIHSLITKVYSLLEINKALEDLEEGRVCRPLIDLKL